MPIKQQIRQFLDKYQQVKYVAVGLIAFLCGLLVGRCGSGNHSFTYHKLSVNEVLDSFVTVIPQGSQMVARFTDDRHALYYLNSGHLMKFNAASKMLEEVDLTQLNSEAEVFFDDREDVQGIQQAQLTPDEESIILSVVTAKPSNNDEEVPLKHYRLNTKTMNLFEVEPEPVKKKVVRRDTTKVVTPQDQPTVEEQPATETPVVAPEKPKEESPKEPPPAGTETVIVPAQ
ncbi:MAG: hypothetical protein IJL29_12460 [Prevotella sp.]|nr:hypothetical protein [Prevotella sp.]MBQ6033807.1 hypothetical protein [Prevotella sp.]